MEQKTQQPNDTAGDQSPVFSVAFLGFEKTDEDTFVRFFQVNRPFQRRYVAANLDGASSYDILMVNYDNPWALKERDTLTRKKPGLPIVAVSRGPLAETPAYHIRGMLFASRVLTTLDKVEVMPAPPPAAEVKQNIKTEQTPSRDVTLGQPTVQLETQPKPQIIPAPTAQAPIPAQASAQPRVIQQPAVPVVPPAPAQPTPVTATQQEGYSVLVVDDSVAIQKSLEINLSTLKRIGRIDFADSGENAIEKAETTRYDVIFLDVMMPGIDGYETCTRIRKKPEYKKTPIIMVSGKTSPLDEVKGVMAGCTTYLTKPVQTEAFQKLSVRVLSWLENQGKR